MNPLDRNYWRHYYDADTVRRSEALRREITLSSTGVMLHVDLYEQQDASAPVLIFNHGGGGNARLFVALALALHERGYTVIAPNQRGQGYSQGDRTDFTIGELVQNIVDVAAWARRQYRGVLFLGGASVGSGLVYNAGAAGAPVDALICHNLYDFGSPRDALALSHFAPLAEVPGFAALSKAFVSALTPLLPWVRIPFEWLGKFDAMVDERNREFYPLWKRDPLPIRAVSLRYLRSTFNTPPAIPLEQNRLPILVINPTRDRMVSPAVTRRNYARLGGDKQYIEIDYGHWATGEAFTREYADVLDGFMRARMMQVRSAIGDMEKWDERKSSHSH